ncbi:hypothetical protein COBT_002602 [Conglomerata obtusa]
MLLIPTPKSMDKSWLDQKNAQTKSLQTHLTYPLPPGLKQLILRELKRFPFADPSTVLQIIEKVVELNEGRNLYSDLVTALKDVLREDVRVFVGRLIMYKRRACRDGKMCRRKDNCIFAHDERFDEGPIKRMCRDGDDCARKETCNYCHEKDDNHEGNFSKDDGNNYDQYNIDTNYRKYNAYKTSHCEDDKQEMCYNDTNKQFNGISCNDNINNNNYTQNVTGIIKKLCRYGKDCARKDKCSFSHTENYVKSNKPCRDGKNCTRRVCIFSHDEPRASKNIFSQFITDEKIVVEKKRKNVEENGNKRRMYDNENESNIEDDNKKRLYDEDKSDVTNFIENDEIFMHEKEINYFDNKEFPDKISDISLPLEKHDNSCILDKKVIIKNKMIHSSCIIIEGVSETNRHIKFIRDYANNFGRVKKIDDLKDGKFIIEYEIQDECDALMQSQDYFMGDENIIKYYGAHYISYKDICMNDQEIEIYKEINIKEIYNLFYLQENIISQLLKISGNEKLFKDLISVNNKIKNQILEIHKKKKHKLKGIYNKNEQEASTKKL